MWWKVQARGLENTLLAVWNFDLKQAVKDGWHLEFLARMSKPDTVFSVAFYNPGTWIAAKGLSDWTKIELLSFQAGGNGITGDTVFLDEIRISK